MSEPVVDNTNLADVFGTKKKKRKPTTTKEKTAEVEKVETKDEKEDKISEGIDSLSLDDKKEEEKKEEIPMDSNEARAKVLSEFPLFVERDYSYEELIARLFGLIRKPEERTTVKIKPPIVYKEGTTRTAWENFPQICTSINRQPDHVLQFVLAEVASTGSIDMNGRLLIRGRFQQKHVERILRHYILEYVQCHTCKSLETKLHKENRLVFMKCDTCGSTRSVAQIKTGFQATTRASRRTEQNKKA